MNKRINFITTIIFCGVLAIMPIWLIVSPDREYSPNENRYLSEIPEFSAEKLISGDFTSKFEDYISDQFPLRDRWVLMNAEIRRYSGRKDNNGVYFGNRLTETFWTYDVGVLDNNLTAINAYASNVSDGHTYFLPVPNRVWAAANETEPALPSRAPDIHQDALIQNMAGKLQSVETIDVSDVIASEAASGGADKLYYGTDHHMTTYGAYEVYKSLGDSLGYSPLGEDEFDVSEICDDFEGTMFHKSGAWWTKADKIEKWALKDDSDISVMIGDETYDSMYDEAALDAVEKYNYFLYGNNPLMVIKNPDARGKLLVVKDSYAHAILPFLANHYGEIHVIDLRYYRGSVDQYRASNEINDTLVIYNVKNLTEDTDIRMIGM